MGADNWWYNWHLRYNVRGFEDAAFTPNTIMLSISSRRNGEDNLLRRIVSVIKVISIPTLDSLWL